jgi:hypothetical protein
MQQSEQERLGAFAVDEFRKRRLAGSAWLAVMLGAVVLMCYGGYRAIFG